jgi:uncharacterized protein
MDIAVTGSSGLIGTALITELRRAGHRAIPVLRPGGEATGDAIRWDPARGEIDAQGFEGLDAVVHLAGEGIGEKRWTDEQKRRVLESRTVPTALLAETLAGLDRPPSVLVSGSAVGWYGDRGDEVLTEASAGPSEPNFLSDVCVQWEAATAAAEAAGIRTVHLRSGIVLAAQGGALKSMLLPFRLGLGGRTGSGRQYMSWIALDDEVGAIVHALTNPAVSGALNATAPTPATNSELTSTLGRVLKRPAVLPTPVPILKLVYGSELVQHLLLEGQRVLPRQLEATGYSFRHADLAYALRIILS